MAMSKATTFPTFARVVQALGARSTWVSAGQLVSRALRGLGFRLAAGLLVGVVVLFLLTGRREPPWLPVANGHSFIFGLSPAYGAGVPLLALFALSVLPALVPESRLTRLRPFVEFASSVALILGVLYGLLLLVWIATSRLVD